MKKSLLTKSVLAASAISLLVSNIGVAGITFDLRAQAGAGVSVDGLSKSATIAGGATSVTLDLWARIVGTDNNSANESMISMGSGIILTPGTFGNITGVTLDTDANVPGNSAVFGLPNTLVGNLAAGPTGQGNAKQGLLAPWDTSSTSTGGQPRQVTGDNSLDISGSTTAAGSGYINANAGAQQSASSGLTPVTQFNLIPNGIEFRIATYNFTVVNGLSGQTTGINFAVPSVGSLNNAARASYFQDGVAKTGTAGAGTISVGAPVILTVVPEPSAFGMVILGAFGLVGFRRVGLQRKA